jgi:hypothetical protein
MLLAKEGRVQHVARCRLQLPHTSADLRAQLLLRLTSLVTRLKASRVRKRPFIGRCCSNFFAQAPLDKPTTATDDLDRIANLPGFARPGRSPTRSTMWKRTKC